ncbi:hypothetical protein [Streptomyces albireticuli]|uniref:hypothetical protein n=1 Tax=Streptomyces albireticuli TaxID=1940 RepID=UPI0036A67ACC
MRHLATVLLGSAALLGVLAVPAHADPGRAGGPGDPVGALLGPLVIPSPGVTGDPRDNGNGNGNHNGNGNRAIVGLQFPILSPGENTGHWE